MGATLKVLFRSNHKTSCFFTVRLDGNCGDFLAENDPVCRHARVGTKLVFNILISGQNMIYDLLEHLYEFRKNYNQNSWNFATSRLFNPTPWA
jgi:hypothetical protein